MNNVDNNNGNNKQKAVSLQIPYTYSMNGGNAVALSTSIWKSTRFITIAENDGNGWSFASPCQIGLDATQAHTVGLSMIKIFNALYPDCPIPEPSTSRFQGEFPDISKLSHLLIPVTYTDKNGQVNETGHVVVGYKNTENGPVIGLSIKSIRNGDERNAFFPFKADVINIDCQDDLGNSIGSKLRSIQGQFLEFVSLFTGMYSGPGMWNTLTTRKIHGTLMYQGNSGGGNNNSGGGNKSNYGGGGNSYNDDTPF